MKFVLSKNKQPVHPLTCIPHDINDSDIHLTPDQAQQLAIQWKCEIGAVIEYPYFAVDIDHALIDSKWSALSMSIVELFKGAYVEVSRSGDGLHVIGKYSTHSKHACKNTSLGIECYTQNRHIVLTGNDRRGSWETDHDSALNETIEKYFKPKNSITSATWTTAPVPEWSGSDVDDVILAKALKSKSMGATFGDRSSFKDLWECNSSKLEKFYPHAKGFDRSSADIALCIHLAFWTGKNCERIERMFNRSALVRDKWESREVYRHDTILNAVAQCGGVYDKGHSTPTGGEIREGYQYLNIIDQMEHFKNCVYVIDHHKVVTTEGIVYKPEQFKATFGGRVFALDSIDDKTTRNSWEAFTESQAYDFPKVKSTVFRPLDKPQSIIDVDGFDMLNTWRILDVPCVQGDISPYLDYLEKLMPVERDRRIFLSYAAACVQFQGVKFQWWVVLQGVQGNGKTFAARAVMQAIGLAHCHVPSSKDLGNKFNAWVSGKTFIFSDEIDDLDYKDQNVLKTLVTSELLDMQGKGADQVMGENCANGMMCMNPRDGIRAGNNERRYCIFFTAQQDLDDLKRDGMCGTYFNKLWDWARAGGFAHITDYLRTYDIADEFNPAGDCRGRAPLTSSSDAVLVESLTAVEAEIVELCNQESLGMTGGWISSISLVRNLDRNISKKQIPVILKNIGYIPHPGLPNGRSTTMIPFDSGKPRIYVKKGHVSLNIDNPTSVMNAFMKAQNAQLLTFGEVRENEQ